MLAQGSVRDRADGLPRSGRSGTPMARTELPSRRYLLRLWLVDGGDPVWRASLEDPSTAERHGFGSMERLFGFLTAETADLAASAAWDDREVPVNSAGHASGTESPEPDPAPNSSAARLDMSGRSNSVTERGHVLTGVPSARLCAPAAERRPEIQRPENTASPGGLPAWQETGQAREIPEETRS
jgi:hypothetical protein